MKRKGYKEKRNHIIQAANTLFMEKGYETTSVEEILKLANISKGTFYHYFSYKLELLEAIVDDFTSLYAGPLKSITNNRDMGALGKLNAVFELNQFMKNENQAILLQAISIFKKEENLIYKERLNNNINKVLTPYLSRILKQGIEEGVFAHTEADEAAALVVQLIFSSRERLIEELMKPEPDFRKIYLVIKTYQQCLERMLAIPEGSLKVFSPDFLK